jgi:hypothetical protein
LSSPAAPAWLAAASSPEPKRGSSGPPRLVAAVAGIVAIAAERARAAGDLGTLREAIERALDAVALSAADPRDVPPADLPRISDTDAAVEEMRLRALAGRPRRG